MYDNNKSIMDFKQAYWKTESLLYDMDKNKEKQLIIDPTRKRKKKPCRYKRHETNVDIVFKEEEVWIWVLTGIMMNHFCRKPFKQHSCMCWTRTGDVPSRVKAEKKSRSLLNLAFLSKSCHYSLHELTPVNTIHICG